jgi:hypothetical protein
MKKKISLSVLIVLAIGCIVILVSNNFKENITIKSLSKEDMIIEIEKYSDRVEESKISSIEKELNVDNKYKAIMIKNEDNKIGMAIFKADNKSNSYKIMDVSFGGRQEYKQIEKSNYYIVYGEKPNSKYKQVDITIESYTNKNEVVHETNKLNLDKGNYYLEYSTLAANLYPSVALPDKYIFSK